MKWSLIACLVILCGCGRNSPSGNATYDRVCAGCHEQGVNNAPPRSALAAMTPRTVVTTLERGRMLPFGSLLTATERASVAEFLTGQKLQRESTPSSDRWRCGEPIPASHTFGVEPRWIGWAPDPANTRSQPGEMARLSVDDLQRLTLAWAFAFPDVIFAWAQPVVDAGVVFVGSYDGTVYALDERSGCIRWSFSADAGVRTAVQLIEVGSASPSGWEAVFGDQHATVYAVDARDGRELWRTRIDDHPMAVITAAPARFGDQLFVPVSSLEERLAINPGYQCCTFRGSVVALDAQNGAVRWKTYTVGEAAHSRRVAWTHHRWGPSGAAVWVTPTVDATLKRIYIATGDNYTDPTTATSDAVMALDMMTGRVLWTKQMLAQDAWTTACTQRDHPSCPDKPGPDFDFAAAPVLAKLPEGGRVLVAAQKSGVVYALDPDRDGALRWQLNMDSRGAEGAFTWGPAADSNRLYIALPIINQRPNRPAGKGGIYALELATGKQVWYTPSPPPKCAGEAGCSVAPSAALTLIPGVLFSATRDGRLIAYSPDTGKQLWEFDTRREVTTVNGVPGHGGSINAAGVTVADGMLFVNSGYGAGGIPGNLLIALGVQTISASDRVPATPLASRSAAPPAP
jgi:polyvinyl alcohol dehydrogenase (cytochrome)